jgi:hypothetical protein
MLPSIAAVERQHSKREPAMLKYALISAAIALSIDSASAQQQASLQKLGVAGADFDIIVATAKSPAGTARKLGNSPEALIVHLIGGELVLEFDDAKAMFKALDMLQKPACAFQLAGKDSEARDPVTVYVVRKDDAAASSLK